MTVTKWVGKGMKQIVHLIHDGRRLCARAASPASQWYGTDDPMEVTCGSCKASIRRQARDGLSHTATTQVCAACGGTGRVSGGAS